MREEVLELTLERMRELRRDIDRSIPVNHKDFAQLMTFAAFATYEWHILYSFRIIT